MERLFDWLDGRPLRRLLVRLVCYSVLLWTTLVIVLLLVSVVTESS